MCMLSPFIKSAGTFLVVLVVIVVIVVLLVVVVVVVGVGEGCGVESIVW